MSEARETLMQASAVAIAGRALVIEGTPGSGKSTLALALIDRGATLIGDDGVTLRRSGDGIVAYPPPNIAGKLEIRGVGLIELPTTQAVPVALILSLTEDADRLPESAQQRGILRCEIPVLPFVRGGPAEAVRAEWALRMHGLG